MISGILYDLLFDYTLRTVAVGAAALGAVSGALGSFAVLRRQSLLGDAISHAALPGIALAFLLTGSRATLVLVLGAALAGWVGTLVVMAVVRWSRIPEDAALGIVLSVFFGAGLVILTFVQRDPSAAQAGLDTFLFGQAATLLERDVAVILGLGAVAVAATVLFWKEFKILSFDPQFGRSMGIPMLRVDMILTTALVIAIVIGLQTVGVVLMSAMVVAPAAAARQWTDRLGTMVFLAAFFGAVAGTVGALVSATAVRVPTGPTIVLVVSALVLGSLLFAPERGLVAAWRREVRNRSRLRTEAVLLDLHALAGQHEDGSHPHEIGALEAMGHHPGGAEETLRHLRKRGYVSERDPGHWVLTEAGRERAGRILRDRGGVP